MTRSRLLIVDDDIVVALDIAETLESLGFETILAHSAAEAIATAGRDRPDLVLMDINLGNGMDGVETARILHQQFSLHSLFVTAYSDSTTRARLEPMAIGVIAKPFTKDQLRLAVTPVMGMV